MRYGIRWKLGKRENRMMKIEMGKLDGEGNYRGGEEMEVLGGAACCGCYLKLLICPRLR